MSEFRPACQEAYEVECVPFLSTGRRLLMRWRCDCVTTQEESDSKVNVEMKMKLSLMKNCECLG